VSEANKLVKELAKTFASSENVQLHVQPINLGPGTAMIRALDWALDTEEMVFVLEDDVFPNSFAADFLNSIAPMVRNSKSLIATGRSPITESSPLLLLTSGISKFALTNGWLIHREVWLEFKKHLQEPLIKELFIYLMRHPLSIRKEHFYFYSAAFLSRNKLLSAWDTQFVFFCLIKQIKTITPNRSCVEIRGVDQVATNTIATPGSTDEVFWKADLIAPSKAISLDGSTQKYYDHLIIENIYHIRKRHFLSPLKSYLRILKDKSVKFYELL